MIKRNHVRLLSVFLLLICLLGGCSGRFIHLTGEITHVIYDCDNVAYPWSVNLENLNFTGASAAKVNVISAEKASVEVRYPEDLGKYGFEVTTKDGEIYIRTNQERSFVAEEFEVTVYANVAEIEAEGGFEMDIDASLCEELQIEIDGAISGTVENLQAARLIVDVDGAATMVCSGTVEDAFFDLDGVGNIDGTALDCICATVDLSGAGNAELNVLDLLDATITGAGSVTYHGDPIVMENIAGIGSVKKAGTLVP